MFCKRKTSLVILSEWYIILQWRYSIAYAQVSGSMRHFTLHKTQIGYIWHQFVQKDAG